MRIAFIALAALVSGTIAAYAACSTHTLNANGRFVTCTTCCNGSFCNTNCF